MYYCSAVSPVFVPWRASQLSRTALVLARWMTRIPRKTPRGLRGREQRLRVWKTDPLPSNRSCSRKLSQQEVEEERTAVLAKALPTTSELTGKCPRSNRGSGAGSSRHVRSFEFALRRNRSCLRMRAPLFPERLSAERNRTNKCKRSVTSSPSVNPTHYCFFILLIPHSTTTFQPRVLSDYAQLSPK